MKRIEAKISCEINHSLNVVINWIKSILKSKQEKVSLVFFGGVRDSGRSVTFHLYLCVNCKVSANHSPNKTFNYDISKVFTTCVSTSWNVGFHFYFANLTHPWFQEDFSSLCTAQSSTRACMDVCAFLDSSVIDAYKGPIDGDNLQHVMMELGVRLGCSWFKKLCRSYHLLLY